MNILKIPALAAASLLAIAAPGSARPVGASAQIAPRQSEFELIAYRYHRHYHHHYHHHFHHHFVHHRRYYGVNPGAAVAGTALGLFTLGALGGGWCDPYYGCGYGYPYGWYGGGPYYGGYFGRGFRHYGWGGRGFRHYGWGGQHFAGLGGFRTGRSVGFGRGGFGGFHGGGFHGGFGRGGFHGGGMGGGGFHGGGFGGGGFHGGGGHR